jgi:hypothetical protein
MVLISMRLLYNLLGTAFIRGLHTKGSLLWQARADPDSGGAG